MKFEKIRSELVKSYNCALLERHFINLFEDCFSFKSEVSSEQFFEKFWPTILNTKYRFFDEKTSRKICREHKIPKLYEVEIFSRIEENGRMYLLFSILPAASKIINEDMERIREISRAADKLKTMLPDKDDPIYVFLQLLSFVDSENPNTDPVGVFLHQMDLALAELVSLPERIPANRGAKLLRVGAKAPKGHINLHMWVEGLYSIWSQILGRNFEYDGPNGVSGKKRFINFAHDCLLPIHENSLHSQVTYTVRMFTEKLKTGDALLTSK